MVEHFPTWLETLGGGGGGGAETLKGGASSIHPECHLFARFPRASRGTTLSWFAAHFTKCETEAQCTELTCPKSRSATRRSWNPMPDLVYPDSSVLCTHRTASSGKGGRSAQQAPQPARQLGLCHHAILPFPDTPPHPPHIAPPGLLQ